MATITLKRLDRLMLMLFSMKAMLLLRSIGILTCLVLVVLVTGSVLLRSFVRLGVAWWLRLLMLAICVEMIRLIRTLNVSQDVVLIRFIVMEIVSVNQAIFQLGGNVVPIHAQQIKSIMP